MTELHWAVGWVLWYFNKSQILLPCLVSICSSMLYLAQKFFFLILNVVYCSVVRGQIWKHACASKEETVPVVQCVWNPASHSVFCQWIRFSPAQHSNIDLLHETIIRIDYCFIFNELSRSYTIEFREPECWQVISETLSNPIWSTGIMFFNIFSCRS